MNFLPRAILLFALGFEWTLQRVYAGNTVCTSNHTDWYTSVIGETPCTTYERLRQICNVDYQVGTLTRNTPPDHCDDQVQDCCCNSISFALSMLCLACQDNTSDGFDAGIGAYQQYLLKDGDNTCSGRKDRNFTVPIQNAVCNTGIKIEDQLYNLFWGDGQWFYVYTRDSIIRDHAAFSNNTQTRCLATTTTTATSTLPSSTSTQSSASTSTSSSSGSGSGNAKNADSGSQLGPGTIAGIVIGVLAILGLLTAIFILLRRRRSTRAVDERPEIDPYTINGTGAASSAYGLSSATTTGYLSDGDATTTSATTPTPISKRNRERRGPPIPNANPSISGSGSGYTPQGSSMAVDHGHELANRLAGPTDRHTDAGPISGANLGRSDSGRLPPAYGEQIIPVGSGIRPTDFRPQMPLSYNPLESRYAQSELDYAPPASSELEMPTGTESEGTSMREVGHDSRPSSRSPSGPLRHKQ